MEQEYKDPKDLRDLTKERLMFEGDRTAYQFKNWRDLFDILIAANKFELAEIYKHSILSNRFLLLDRENMSETKLFTKQEVLEMLGEAHIAGWYDCAAAKTLGHSKQEAQKSYLDKKQNI